MGGFEAQVVLEKRKVFVLPVADEEQGGAFEAGKTIEAGEDEVPVHVVQSLGGLVKDGEGRLLDESSGD